MWSWSPRSNVLLPQSAGTYNIFKKINQADHVKTIYSFLLLASVSASVSATNCPQHFAAGLAPMIVNQKMAAATQELCYEGYGAMHSGVTRTPLWSAEHLTRANLEVAQSLSREDSFHPDPNLLINGRAELKDYSRSGYDRGHMSPNSDFSTRTAQYESFSLGNIVPQDANNNRQIWSGVERSTRRLAKAQGELYVITGPAFLGNSLNRVGNVLVPTHLYKVVYSPMLNQAAAYFVANTATSNYSVISISMLEAKIGINLLPGVSQSVKNTAMQLPAPTPYSRNESGYTQVGIDQISSASAAAGAGAINYVQGSKLVNAAPAIAATVQFIRNIGR